jgi:hypothetical protein
MATHAYTEGQLVEQPATGLFAELGWLTVSAIEEVFGPGKTLRRDTPREVILLPRAYDKVLYAKKCSVLFEHVYESYPEADAGSYSDAR